MPSLRSLLLTAPLLLAMPCATALAGERIVVKAPSDARIRIIYSHAIGVEAPPVITVIVTPQRRLYTFRRSAVLYAGFRNQYSGPKYPF